MRVGTETLVERNESAASFQWLVDGLGLGHPRGSLVDALWVEIRDGMRRPHVQNVHFTTDWISDPWLAKGVWNADFGNVAPVWSPPDGIDAWPTFDIGATLAAVGITARRTRDASVVARLAAPAAVQPEDSRSAIAEFYESEGSIARHGDTRMVFGEHIRAWLLTSCGPLLRQLLLSSVDQAEIIAGATVEMLGAPIRIPLQRTYGLANDFGDKHVELLLNITMQRDGKLVLIDPVDLRVGQGTAWRESWAWLSQEISASSARQAVRLAARLLRNAAMREGVTRALRSDDVALRTIAVAMVRRWALTLKAMTWVEDALAAPWQDIRPADIVCLGFSAIKPDWPRRIVAISHRSAEVKPVLRQMSVWSSSRCAIDATYMPAWETNTGMIWGLFGPTPALVRIATPSYRKSKWCRREAELIQYLVETSDFLSDRQVVDLDLDGLRALTALDGHWRDQPPDPRLGGVVQEFPPMIQVWTPMPLPTWEAATLRAAGALRAMSAFLRDPELVNGLVVDGLLVHGDLPGPAPTNHPDGWRAYARIFRDLHELVPEGPERFAILLPAGYDADQVERDDDVLTSVPDLASGSPSLDDVLVAVEFLRTRWPVMVDQGYGRFLALNLHGISHDTLATHAQLSLQRGLLAMRTPVPLWLLQLAGQDVSSWDLPGDPPILTEHVEAQFGWMREMYPDPDAARSLYPAHSGLQVSAALRRLLGAPE